jgi:hypothetical protein
MVQPKSLSLVLAQNTHKVVFPLANMQENGDSRFATGSEGVETTSKNIFFGLVRSTWEKQRHHLIFTQTALSAMTHSDYGSGNAQALGFWVLPKCWGSIQNSTTLELWSCCGAGGKLGLR